MDKRERFNIAHDFSLKISKLAIEYAEKNAAFNETDLLNAITMFFCATMYEMQDQLGYSILSPTIENIIANYEKMAEQKANGKENN